MLFIRVAGVGEECEKLLTTKLTNGEGGPVDERMVLFSISENKIFLSINLLAMSTNLILTC